MGIEVRKYNLPDIEILNDYREDCKSIIWIPDKIYIVLGISNKAEDALIADNIVNDNVPVLKRPSGGETVVLSPKTLVISAIDTYSATSQHPPATSNQQPVTSSQQPATRFNSPKEYFKLFNTKIISALSKLGVRNLKQKGISDIAIGEKKILGSAIYRTRDKIFYQSVLNISENPELFERYLKHPKKEPDYRKGRGHKDFVSSVYKEGYKIGIELIVGVLKDEFK
jgi:lipoate---protein ligase